MSTIAVARKGQLLAIAADTLTALGSMQLKAPYKAAPDKILRLGDSYLGTVGSTAHRLVLESYAAGQAESPLLSGRLEIFEFFRRLHPVLKSEYFINPKEDEKDPYESSQMDLLIANPYGIYSVMSYREVTEYSRFWAIGSGAEYALGAMQAVYDQFPDAQKVAEVGVGAAIEFDDGTDAPITSYAITLGK